MDVITLDIQGQCQARGDVPEPCPSRIPAACTQSGAAEGESSKQGILDTCAKSPLGWLRGGFE